MSGLGKLGKFATGRLSELKLSGNSSSKEVNTANAASTSTSFTEGPSVTHTPSSAQSGSHQQIAKDAKQLLETSVCTNCSFSVQVVACRIDIMHNIHAMNDFIISVEQSTCATTFFSHRATQC
jgi:hypothetical protein